MVVEEVTAATVAPQSKLLAIFMIFESCMVKHPFCDSSHSPKKKRILAANKASVGTMGRPALRSRSDQYFYESQY